MTAVMASSFSFVLAAGSTVPAEEAENVRPRDRVRRGLLALSTRAGIGPWYDARPGSGIWLALEVERLGHGRGAGGQAQLGQPEELLGGTQQGVVVKQRAGPGPHLGTRADHEGREVAAGVRGVGRAVLTVGVTAHVTSLIEGDEDHRRAVLVLGAVEDRRQVVGHPAVAVGDGSVMHVVDQVGRNKGER